LNPENSPAVPTSPRARLPVSRPATSRIEAAGGLEHVCGLILDGQTHAQIAAAIGVARSDLTAYLGNSDSPLYASCMAASAESLYDAAEAVLRAAQGKTMADVQIAREIAGMYVRRAGVRNALYRDRVSQATAVMLNTPAQPTQVPQFVLVVHGQTEGRTIDHDPDG
jgi:hypothetical protein